MEKQDFDCFMLFFENKVFAFMFCQVYFDIKTINVVLVDFNVL